MPPAVDADTPTRPRRGSARDRLLAAALDKLATAPPHALSLDEIRRAAGVSVGALYHHFPDKSALVDALYVELIERSQAEILATLRAHPGAEDGIRAVVRWYLGWIADHRAAAALLLGHRPDSAALRDANRRFFAETTAWWDTHAHYGTVRHLSPDLVHALWLGPAHDYARHWLAGHVSGDPHTVAETLADAAWHALKEPA